MLRVLNCVDRLAKMRAEERRSTVQKRTKTIMAVTIALALVFGGVAAAFATHVITLSAKPTAVVYPHSSKLTVNVSDAGQSVPATLTIQSHYVDGGDWTFFRSITASKSAEGTFTVPVPALKGTTEFRVLESGVATSEVVTISVAANLSAPRVPAVFKFVGKRTGFVVTGSIRPRHNYGSKPVLLELKRYDTASKSWVSVETTLAQIVKPGKGELKAYKAGYSFWRGSFASIAKPSTRSTVMWRVEASHEDTAHVKSTSKSKQFRIW